MPAELARRRDREEAVPRVGPDAVRNWNTAENIPVRPNFGANIQTAVRLLHQRAKDISTNIRLLLALNYLC